jgi:hypothetical protein
MVENAIADEICRAERDEDVEELGKDAVNKVLEITSSFKSDKPDTKIIIITPLRRPGLIGFNEYLNTWSTYMEGCTRSLMKDGIFSIRPMKTSDQDYDAGGIHLTQSAGKKFIVDLLTTISQIMEDDNAEINLNESGNTEHNDTMDQTENEVTNEQTSAAGRLISAVTSLFTTSTSPRVNKTIDMIQTGTLEERVERLETRLAKVVETCKNHDFKLFRISGESDGKHNQERKTRIKITGLRNPGDCPEARNEKKCGEDLESVIKQEKLLTLTLIKKAKINQAQKLPKKKKKGQKKCDVIIKDKKNVI